MAQSAFDKTLMGGPPYFDDFDEAKRFLKVLFRPGRPLQSRELAQVQSILQNQIERFGRCHRWIYHRLLYQICKNY